MPQAVFCDEAGFSGNNLLDPSQPFFTYAAVAIDPDEAREVVAKVVRDFAIHGGELKGLTVYCDESKPLRQHREHFHMMIGRTDRTYLTIEGKRQSLIFNLAQPLQFVRSDEHCGIQLADVIANAFVYARFRFGRSAGPPHSA